MPNWSRLLRHITGWKRPWYSVLEIRLELKQEAYTLGLTKTSLMGQVRSAYYGALSQRMQDGKNEIWVYVRYPMENRENVGQLENMMITTPAGEFPLYQLA